MRQDSCADVTDLARELDPAEMAALDRAGAPDPVPGAGRARRLRGVPAIPPVPPEAVSPPLRRGRGATVNPPNRFERQEAAPFDDGWATLGAEFTALPPLPTTLTRDASRSVIAWNKSPDIGFDRAVNPYRGCEHGCIYCYARPSHAYLGYSPGLDFETRLTFKPDVAELLEKELRKPGYVARTLALGSNTDPYQPIEREYRITRQTLEVLLRYRHPVTIITKGSLILRDLDLLELGLGDTSVDDRAIDYILNMTNLEGLYLNRTGVSKSGILKLAKLKPLKKLKLEGCPQIDDDSDIKYLKKHLHNCQFI